MSTLQYKGNFKNKDRLYVICNLSDIVNTERLFFLYVLMELIFTYVSEILKNVKIDLGLFFPNCPQSHAITSTNRMVDYIAVQNSRDCRAD